MKHYNNNLTFKEISVLDLSPHPQNPNTHSQQNLNEITFSIENVGYIDPVVVRPYNGKYQILSGEGRFLACKKSGKNSIPVIIVELDDEKALAYMIASNEIPRSSEINPERFETVIQTLHSINEDFKWESIGLSNEEASALLNFNKNVINDGDMDIDPHEGIKEKVKPLRLDLEQRAFLDYVIQVFKEVTESSNIPESEAVMAILADWVAGVTEIPLDDEDIQSDTNLNS